jgi:hypothetical protein
MTKPQPATPSDAAFKRLADLLRERDSALVNLMNMEARQYELTNATKDEPAIRAELDVLTALEAKEMGAWADDGGAHGPAPEPHSKARQKLEAKLTAAQSKARAARTARDTVEAAMEPVRARLLALEPAIGAAVHDVLIEKRDQHKADMDRHIQDARALAANVVGLGSYIAACGRTLMDRMQTEAGTAYLRRAEALGPTLIPDLAPSRAEIATAELTWAALAENALKEAGAVL